MKVSSASTDVSLPAVAPTETPMGEVSRDQPLAEPSEELTGPSESQGPPASRLKLTVKRAQVPQEELPTDDLSGRPRRTVKAPDAFAPAPVAVEKPKRGRGSRKKEANIVCVHCQRGHSPNTNMIVFCDGCNKAWHQKCHDPPIDAEVVRVKEAEWFCHQCKPVPPASPVTSQPAQAMKTARTVHPRLQQGPRLDVGANEFTADERRAYLSHLSHAELVELLVHVSSRNPAVPIFPRNLRDLPASEFPCPVSRTDATTASAATTAIRKPSILKKRTREASAAIEKSAEEEPATRPRKRSRTTSAPAKPQSVAPSKKRTRAASAVVEDSSDEDPATTARKRPRTTSAPTKPATAQAAASKSSKGSKNSKGPAKGSSTTSTKSSSKASAKDSGKSSTASNARSRTTSTSTRRQASAQPSVSTSTTTRTTRSQNRSLTPMPPPRTTRDTSAEEASEPETEQDDSDDEFEEVEDHRVLPRPGHGFSPPSPLFDPRLLQEPAESQTFSHALYGPAKMGKVTKKPSQVRGKSVKK